MRKSFVYMLIIGGSVSVLTSCSNASGKKEEAIAKLTEIRRVEDSLKLDSFKRVEAAKTALREVEEEKANTKKDASIIRTTRTNTVIQAANTQPVATQKKKGWSDAAKGGVIGGVAGAGIGALIDGKKPVRGAVIGAAVGGGSGYVIGRKSDRNSGRVQR